MRRVWSAVWCETVHVLQSYHYPRREPWGEWFCGRCGRRVW